MLFHFPTVTLVEPLKIEPARLCHILPMRHVEHACYTNPWTVAAFHRAMAHPAATRLVVTFSDTVVGYAFAFRPRRWPRNVRGGHDRMEIINLTVHPQFRRRGIGRMLVDAVKFAAGDGAVHVDIPERALVAQLFYRANGFRAEAILRGYYGDQDAYQFEFHGL